MYQPNRSFDPNGLDTLLAMSPYSNQYPQTSADSIAGGYGSTGNLDKIIALLSQLTGQQKPMFAAQSIRPISAVQNKWQQVSEAANEPVAPAATPQQNVQYIKPAKVKTFSDKSVRRWDSYEDRWVPMSADEIDKYLKAGGVIGE